MNHVQDEMYVDKDSLQNYIMEQGITLEEELLSSDEMDNPDEVMEVEV